MFNKDNIMLIRYTNKIIGVEIEKIALYNKTKIFEEEVWKAIELDGIGYNPDVILMYKDQYESVFFGI